MNLGLIALFGALQTATPLSGNFMELGPDTVYQPYAAEVAGFLKEYRTRQTQNLRNPEDPFSHRDCWQEKGTAESQGADLISYCETNFLIKGKLRTVRGLEFISENNDTIQLVHDVDVLGRASVCLVLKRGEAQPVKFPDRKCAELYVSILTRAHGFLKEKYAKKEK